MHKLCAISVSMFNNLELGVFSEGKHYGDFTSLRNDKINDCFIY